MDRKKVTDFLRRRGMDSERIDPARCTGEFLQAMRDGLAGRPSSLLMIPTYLDGAGALPAGEAALVMDAGGTNLRIARVSFDRAGKAEITGFRKLPMPGTEGTVTCDEFFDALAGYLLDCDPAVSRVGFCFSFPTEILPDRDGRILSFAKEVDVTDAAGRLIGAGINAALRARGAAEKQFCILNDTVAVMLSAASQQDRDGLIGFILGTGTNTCYLERTGAIGKIGGGPGQMAVNVESGCYDGLPRGMYDEALDAASRNPGDHLLEKMIGGVYLGEVLTRTLRGAAAYGLFSDDFSRRLDPARDYALAEFSAFSEGGGPLASLCASADDREVLAALYDNAIDRAARVIAVNFAAILTQTGAGRDPARPACIAAEGTTFFKAAGLRSRLEHYLAVFLRGTLGIHCRIVPAEDATLAGSAAAALLNTDKDR